MTTGVTTFLRRIIEKIGRFQRDRADIDQDPALEKLRRTRDDMDALIERRYGRDFLENMILAREAADDER